MDASAASLRDCVRRALAEDLGADQPTVDDDITSRLSVPVGRRGKARLLAKSSGVLAGLACAVEAFRQMDASAAVRLERAEGV